MRRKHIRMCEGVREDHRNINNANLNYTNKKIRNKKGDGMLDMLTMRESNAK